MISFRYHINWDHLETLSCRFDHLCQYHQVQKLLLPDKKPYHSIPLKSSFTSSSVNACALSSSSLESLPLLSLSILRKALSISLMLRGFFALKLGGSAALTFILKRMVAYSRNDRVHLLNLN